jgi:hypothetical protein
VATEGFTGSRYGGFPGIGRAVGVFVLLFVFAAYVIIDSRHLMSNYCFDDTGQIVCPISGPEWARPVPGAVTLLGLLVGLIGLAVGRPARAAALISGFLLAGAGLVSGWLIG